MDAERLFLALILKEGFSKASREDLENELVDKVMILGEIVEAFENAGFTVKREKPPQLPPPPDERAPVGI